MKRLTALLLTLLLAMAMTLALAACGGKDDLPPDQEETPPQAGVMPEGTPETPPAEAPAPDSAREQTTTLTYFLEGDETSAPATLFTGDGFSLYLTDGTWVHESGTYEGFPEEEWEAAVNDDVSLTVVNFGSKTPEEARALLLAEEEEYDLITDKRGGLGGMDQENQVLDITFFEGTDALFAVLCAYPLEASEGFGTTMRVLVDTFQTET